MRVAWSDHYAMGLEQLDHDHQQLFKMAERMIHLMENTDGRDEKSRLFVVREGVKYLRNYFLEHAEREEAYMRQISYPDYAAHKRLHDEFRYIELGKYEKIVERGMCTRDEVFDFIGTGVGWLLEHIATADMAIVGKGILCQPALPQDDRTALEREVNLMFAATLNLDLHARIINSGHQWEALDEAIYQRRVYRSQTDQMEIISGIEKRFLIRIAQMVYGEELRDADALILSSLEIFGANFWRTLSR